MKKSIKLMVICFMILGISACKKTGKEAVEKRIEEEKTLLTNNISEILDGLDYKDRYLISIFYQQSQEHSKRVISEEVITKRVFGKADFFEDNSPEKVDGMWEEKAYRANYDDKKEDDDFIGGYFSVIIIIDKIDKEKQDKIMSLMNYSVANTSRGDLINVVSKSDY
jgi:hypothetical protein